MMAKITHPIDDSQHATPYIGQLNIALETRPDGEITNVHIINSRPKNIGQLLIGKTSDQALITIPKLFLLCSQAQQTAAISAIAGLNNRVLSSQQQLNLATRCALEWLKEHSWQLWQMERELFGDTFAIKESLALTKYLLKQIQTEQAHSDNAFSIDRKNTAQDNDYVLTYADSVDQLLWPLFGCKPSEFTEFTWEELLLWSNSPAPYSRLFHALQQDNIKTLGSFPHWHLTLEEGSLSRQREHPLVLCATERWGASVATRTLARMIEMIAVNKRCEISLAKQAGTAFASRGSVKHDISIDAGGIITQYIIDAPTDRYFAPNGLVENALLGQRVPEMNIKWIRQLIWSIDPCVEFTISVNQHITDVNKEN